MVNVQNSAIASFRGRIDSASQVQEVDTAKNAKSSCCCNWHQAITLFTCKWFEAFKCASHQSRLGRRHVCWVPAHVQHELRSDQVRCPCRLRHNHLILARASPKLLLQLRNRQHFPGTKIEGFQLKTWCQACYHLHLQFLSLNHKIEGPFNRFPMGNPMPVPQIWSCGRSNSRQDQKLAMLGIDEFKMQRRWVHIQTSHGIDIGCVPWPQRDERRDNGRAVAISEYFGFKAGNMDVHTGSWSLAVHVFWLDVWQTLSLTQLFCALQ